MNKLYKNILDKNFKILNVRTDSIVLDIGCGNGDFVNYLCQLGFDAYGIDIEFKKGKFVNELKKNGRINIIKTGRKSRKGLDSRDKYEWPNFNNKFDVMISRAVIEHVGNLDEFVKNSKEHLEKKGLIIHYYPVKTSIIEPHTGVPFGALLTFRLWFFVMCSIRLCYKKYRGNNWEKAYYYMKDSTLFRWQGDIDKIYYSYGFNNLDLTKNILSSHPNQIVRMLGRVPGASWLFGLLRSKVIAYYII